MAVMALANMTLEYRKVNDSSKCYEFKNVKDNISSATSCEQNNPYFHIEREIVPYVEKNWVRKGNILDYSPSLLRLLIFGTIVKVQ
jgi:hypothetical protein